MEEQPKRTQFFETDMWPRKKLRIAARAKTYTLNPSRQYQRDMEMVLRKLAWFIARSGFCPSTKVLAQRHTWSAKGCEQYLNDLLADGLVTLHYGKVWTPTDEGYRAIGKIPMKPLLPPEYCARASTMADARRIARRLEDPELRAAYLAFYDKNAPQVAKRAQEEE